MAKANSISSLQDLLAEVEKSGIAAQRHAHIRVWYRGQPKAGLPLHPGVYRATFGAKDETERLDLERHLTQDFRVLSSGLRMGRDAIAEIYFLQQHYRMPTRLLDWTTSPLAGLHFAIGGDPNADAELFQMDAYRLAIMQKAKDFLGVGTQRNPLFKKGLEAIFSWEDASRFPKFIMPIRPDYMDARINAQSSCFTFHVPAQSELTEAVNDTLRRFMIPAASKIRIRKELFLLGVDDFSIYGDLESLSRRLRTAHHIE